VLNHQALSFLVIDQEPFGRFHEWIHAQVAFGWCALDEGRAVRRVVLRHPADADVAVPEVEMRSQRGPVDGDRQILEKIEPGRMRPHDRIDIGAETER
jgi:hypothetical protein